MEPDRLEPVHGHGQREDYNGVVAEGRGGVSSAPPSDEQGGGPAEGRAGASSTPPSGEQGGGAAEGRASASSPRPRYGRDASESRCTAAGGGKNFGTTSSSESSTNEQARACPTIRVLSQHAYTPRARLVRDSVGISCPKPPRPRRISLEWLDDDKSCPGPKSSKVSEQINYDRKERQDEIRERARACPTIRALSHAYTPRARHIRDSIDISCSKPRRPRRISLINRQFVLKEWPDDDKSCPGAKSSKVSEQINYDRKERQNERREKVPAAHDKGGAPCAPVTESELTTVPIRCDADLESLDPNTTRVSLPSDLSREDLVSLLKTAKRRGFKQFVNNNAFRWALIHRYCSLYGATSKRSTRH